MPLKKDNSDNYDISHAHSILCTNPPPQFCNCKNSGYCLLEKNHFKYNYFSHNYSSAQLKKLNSNTFNTNSCVGFPILSSDSTLYSRAKCTVGL